MTTPEVAATEPEPVVAAPQSHPPAEASAEVVVVTAPAEPEVAVENGVVEPKVAVENGAVEPAVDAPKKRGRKRKVDVTEDKTLATEVAAVADGAADVATATEPASVAVEKSPKEKKLVAKKPKATKAAAAPATPTKRKLGRPRKIVKEETESEDDTETELRTRVDAFPNDIKAKFGSIVWAKMVGFPYWPALITDPRLLHPKFHASAMKEIETKYFVCFYQSNDFSPVLFKNIEAWDDTKHDYRAGHPTKDAKAPKRRSQLMVAIELADKDALLPVDERMDGLMKVVPEETDMSPEEKEPKPVAPKRKLGRPPGSKNKPKVTSDATTAEAPSPAPKTKRGRKKSTEAEEGDNTTDKVTTPQTPDDDEAVPPLSKDEIKAKVASRKSPSKKKAATTDEKSAAAVTKKAAKTSTKNESIVTKSELDSKRKKEIELVVPRKSVKSADIREATEEAARKKPGPREKPKDKGNYGVGNLTQFAGKMNRLFANESSKNNDELIVLLIQLFEEKIMYRSDVERSGVASVIAVLRKSQNPTVAQTASAVRKHLMLVLNDDVAEKPSALKKHKAEGSAVDTKAAKKQKTSPLSDTDGSPVAPAPTSAETSASEPLAENEANGSSEAQEPGKEESSVDVAVEVGASEAVALALVDETKPAPVDETNPSTAQESAQPITTIAPTPTPTEDVTPDATKQEPATPISPVKSDPILVATEPKPDPSGDKNRMVCIDMLKKALEPIGARADELAREIEAQVFERFSESNEEYRTCARSITFGLKKHAHVRERLKNGDLHALELAYSPDDILKP